VSGIVFVIKNGLRWRDAPKEDGPNKTLYNRFIRWSRMGCSTAFSQILLGQAGASDRLTAASLLKKGLFPRYLGRTKGGATIAARAPSSQATVSPPASSLIISAVMSPEPSAIWREKRTSSCQPYWLLLPEALAFAIPAACLIADHASPEGC
jgi:putative transposase